jgi:death-on-curing protein
LPSEPRWLPIDAVIEKNRLEVEETGEDIVVLAVRLLAAIAQAHAFEQGNKRTAFGAMWHFLRLNGYDLAIEDSDFWEGPTVELIEHRLSEEEFAARLRPFIVER